LGLFGGVWADVAGGEGGGGHRVVFNLRLIQNPNLFLIHQLYLKQAVIHLMAF
jgi:hypothetical protein